MKKAVLFTAALAFNILLCFSNEILKDQQSETEIKPVTEKLQATLVPNHKLSALKR